MARMPGGPAGTGAPLALQVRGTGARSRRFSEEQETQIRFRMVERCCPPAEPLVRSNGHALCLARIATCLPSFLWNLLMDKSRDQLKVGLVGVGLDTYWPQFPGLRDTLTGFTERVAKRLESTQVEVINLGLIDTPEKSLAAGHEFRKADVDLIFLYVTTYALSSTVLPAVRRAKVPVIILNLSPAPAMDYEHFNRLGDRTRMTGEWLAFCQACPVPEIANVFHRCRIPFFQVSGILDDDPVAWTEISEWVEAARVANIMEHNRLGVMGNYYGGMLDIYSDFTQQCAYFGGHIEIVGVEELAALRRAVTDADASRRVQEFRTWFDIQADCSAEELV